MRRRLGEKYGAGFDQQVQTAKDLSVLCDLEIRMYQLLCRGCYKS